MSNTEIAPEQGVLFPLPPVPTPIYVPKTEVTSLTSHNEAQPALFSNSEGVIPELSDEAKHEVILHILSLWRGRGFPYYSTDFSTREHEWERFVRSGSKTVLYGDTIRQTMAGLALAWSYFPHAWEIRVRRSLSPMDVWESDELMLRAIKRRLERSEIRISVNTDLSPARLRKALGSIGNVQRVANFRPTAAWALYDRYADGAVWDLSSGFGGRLLGAIASERVSSYIGTDPSTKTFAGLQALSEDFSNKTHTNVELHCVGSEDFVPEANSLSLAFTSPPYFSTERYANEPTQSFIRFPEKELWNEGFLRKSIENAHIGLRKGGHLILNVANTREHSTLEADTVRISVECGFQLETTLQLALSAVSKGGFKYEPTFVFVKR